MDASAILDGMKPLALLIDDVVQGDSQVYLQRLVQMKTHQDWSRLDTLADDVTHLTGVDPDYAVLLLHLADAYRENGKLRTAERYCNRALSRLGCQIDAGCVQNRAVATLCRAILVHMMGRPSESLQHYQHATTLFRQAAANWNDLPGHGPSADRCRHAADKLEHYTEELARSMVPAPPAQRASTWRPRSVRPVSPVPGTTTPLAGSNAWVGLLYLGVLLVFWIVFLAVIALLLGGPIAFLVFASTVLTSGVVVATLARSRAGHRLFLQVPMEHIAIVEQGGLPVLVGPCARRLLLPWAHRLRAVVPIELDCTISKQKVSLGRDSSSGKNRYMLVTVMIRYKIVDPIAAVYFFQKSVSTEHLPVPEKELKTLWDAQLGSDLLPLLVDHLWGADESDCYSHRNTIQANLENDLRSETRRWGIDILGLGIVDMAPY